jgi:hypothetical protein
MKQKGPVSPDHAGQAPQLQDLTGFPEALLPQVYFAWIGFRFKAASA